MMQQNSFNSPPIGWIEWGWVALIALLLISGVDILTNTMDTTLFEGDFIYYIDMAENGVVNNPNLVAPFAYRPLTPLLARSLADLTGGSLETGFRLVAWLGAMLTLVSTYTLARTIGAQHKYAILIMVMVAGSFYHLKYLLFDVYRPDHLAYGLLIVAFLALLRKQWIACMLVSAVGLLAREFFVIPLLLLLLQQLLILRQVQEQRTVILLRLVAGGLVMVGFIVLPRMLLPVETTVVYATLFKPNPTSLETITLPLTSIRRNLNLVFALVAYVLPLLWLGGRTQFRVAWQSLGEIRWLVGGYIVLVLMLTLIGGTDLARFVTYLHIPFVIFASLLLKQDTPPILLIGMILTLIIFNRIPFLIPQDDYNRFIDFYGAYHDRINAFIIARWQELIVFLFVAFGLRGGLAIIARERDAKNTSTNV